VIIGPLLESSAGTFSVRPVSTDVVDLVFEVEEPKEDFQVLYHLAAEVAFHIVALCIFV
jgi:hypothetical protein